MIIRYDVKARYQIEEIFQYGKSNFGSQTALRYIQKMRENINGLKQHPLAGSIEWLLTDKEHEYRFIFVKPYKVIYSIKGEIIRIHLFWHTYRNPDTLKSCPLEVCEPSSPYGKE